MPSCPVTGIGTICMSKATPATDKGEPPHVGCVRGLVPLLAAEVPVVRAGTEDRD